MVASLYVTGGLSAVGLSSTAAATGTGGLVTAEGALTAGAAAKAAEQTSHISGLLQRYFGKKAAETFVENAEEIKEKVNQEAPTLPVSTALATLKNGASSAWEWTKTAAGYGNEAIKLGKVGFQSAQGAKTIYDAANELDLDNPDLNKMMEVGQKMNTGFEQVQGAQGAYYANQKALIDQEIQQ